MQMIQRNEVLESHRDTLAACYFEQYYVHIVDHFAKTMQVKTEGDVYAFWNRVWDALPDSPAIRRSPFFQICDLAEGSYLDED
jgi:hypothetical protein